MLLDTDVLIELIRGDEKAAAWFDSLTEIPPISGIAALELTFGSRDRDELRRVRGFLAPFPVLWPSEADMLIALTLADVKLSHSLGVMDALIAATAVNNDLEVGTFNRKHFAGVPGLKIVTPYAR